MEEKELAERCKQADDLACQQLYERYAGRLLGICFRYVGNREQAEDLLHDGFIKIFSSLNKFTWRGEGSLKAWLDRVMVNECLQCLRKNDLLTHSYSLDDSPQVYEEPDPDEVESLPPDVLMGFIRELPEGYRTVFNLFAIEGRSHREIAELLGINEKSSSSQFYRAKTLLAKKIKNYLNEQ